MSVRVVGASAGSGKTRKLSEEITAAVDPTEGAPVPLDGLVAVTYTRKAAAELTSRIRRVLTSRGQHGQAGQLPLAYLGTVHSVCQRLIREFALDAGLSPQIDVMPEGESTRLLEEALQSCLDAELRARLDATAEALHLHYDDCARRADWLSDVHAVMSLARSNRIAPAALPAMAERSAAELLALLPPPLADGELLDCELAAQITDAIRYLEAAGDAQKNTQAALHKLRDVARALEHRPLDWVAWARIAKLSPAVAHRDALAPLRRAVSVVERHPRLHAHLRDHIVAVFDAAARALSGYATWKAERGYVDFVDLEEHALALLERDDIAAELGTRLHMLAVDEFQDTSPIQLAIFTRLHRIAGRSLWVGDRKQCIFEFAGADPALMQSVLRWAGEQGDPGATLDHNYRSRPSLVRPISQLFTNAFAAHGFTRDEVAVAPKRSEPAELTSLPPFGLWALESSQRDEAEAIAEGVRRMLETPGATPIVDPTTGVVRPVAPGDIAVLAFTNAQQDRIAEALERRGVRVARARSGLLLTPEGTLVSAALHLLLEPRNHLARAEIEALLGFAGDPDGWLAERIDATARRRAGEPVLPRASLADRIDALRADLPALAPSEALDGVLHLLDLSRLCSSWPRPEERRNNLGALRALAAAYEQRCEHRREAGTLAGLLRFFAEACGNDDAQHAHAGPGAVTLSTYHRAKGLEWPVVIMTGLDRARRRSVFGVASESNGQRFDPEQPLAGRWIRYWPWPFGTQQNGIALAQAAAQSAPGERVAAREDAELVRLLYVGFTRARDHLVLAARTKRDGVSLAVAWLDHLRAGDQPALRCVAGDDGALGALHIAGLASDIPALTWRLDRGSDPPARLPTVAHHAWIAPAIAPASSSPDGAASPRATYRIAPSSAAAAHCHDLPTAHVIAVDRLGGRIPFEGKHLDWATVGSALHAFLAADVESLEPAHRLALAQRSLAAANLSVSFHPEHVVSASDALRAYLEERYPDASWQREVPIAATLNTPHGRRRIDGVIDLVLHTRAGLIIVDHKSYPGGPSTWRAQALEHGPQLAAYATAVTLVPGVRVRACYVHFLLGGGIVELGFDHLISRDR